MKLFDRTIQRLQLLAGASEKRLYLAGLRSLDSLALPDFLGIGFMKSGTTWLYENLRAHPDVFVSDHKELRYFDRNFSQSLTSYAANFDAAPEGKVKGEVSPSYAVIPEDRIDFIHRIMPDVRLILLMRDPIAREWSRVVHMVRRSGRTLAEVGESELFELVDRSNVIRLGGYAAIIDRWQAVFPDEQLLLGIYEDIESQPRTLLQTVFEHVGVRTDIDWNTLPYNKVIIPPIPLKEEVFEEGRGIAVENHTSPASKIPAIYRDHLAERYHRDLAELQGRFGDRLGAWTTSLPSTVS